MKVLLLLVALLLGVPTQAQVFGVTNNAQVNLVLSCSPTSGTAPLAVFCDMTSSTASQTSNPFHDLGITCDFGDGSLSTFAYGTQPGVASQNAGFGPYQAVVYNSAGAKTITCTGRHGTITNIKTASITVTAADTTWANEATLCIRQTTGGSFATCPSGADTATDASFNNVLNVRAGNGTTYKRIVFECGGTFAANQAVLSATGPGYVGSHPVDCLGAGRARPIVSSGAGIPALLMGASSNNSFGDWRVAGLDFNGTSGSDTSAVLAGGAATAITFYGNTFRGFDNGFNLSFIPLNNINVSSQLAPVWNKWALVGNIWTGTFRYGFLGALVNSAVMGNSITGQSSQHAFRTAYASRLNVSNNSFTGTATGSALTIRAVAWDIANRGAGNANQHTIPANSYTEYVYVHGNRLTAVGAGNVLTFTASNGTELPRFQKTIADSNLLITTATGGLPFTSAAGDQTVRNNLIIDARTGDQRMFEFHPPEDPVLTSYYFYNNSAYTPLTTASVDAYIGVANFSGNAFTVNARNNLGVSPSNTAGGTAPMLAAPGTSGAFAAGTNSTAAQMKGASPLTATPPTTAADFQPSAGTYPIDAGTSVPVWHDFNGALRSGTYDLGAVNP